MKTDEFARVVRLGLGRAVTFLQTHDPAPYSSIVLEACLNDWSFESMEPTRERYLLELTRSVGIEGQVREQIFDAMAMADDDTDLRQIAALTRLLAQDGDAYADHVLNETFVRLPHDEDLPEEILELNGLDGLVLIARTHGALLRSGEGVEEINQDILTLNHIAERQFGQATVAEALERGSSDPDVGAYVAQLRRRQAETAKSPRRDIERGALLGRSYDEFKTWIVDPTRRGSRIGPYPWGEWGKHASEEDLLRAAKDFLTVPDDEHDLLSRYVRTFGQRAFPLEPDRLIAIAHRGRQDVPWAFDEAEPDDWLAMFALQALGNVRHPDVRVFALELGEWSRWTSKAASLIVANYQDGDLAILTDLFNREQDPNERHWIGSWIRDLFDTIRAPGIEQALIHIYETGPCAACREFIVYDLLKANLLPDALVAECRFDANRRIREMMAEHDERNRR